MSDAQAIDQIASSVAASKPDFREIDPSRIADLIRGLEDGKPDVRVWGVHGGGANAGASSGVVVFKASIGSAEGRYVLRYAPMNREGRIFVEYCIPEQFELQRRLAAAGLSVPMARWLDPDGGVLGQPGFVMDRIDGDVAHAAPFQAGLIGDAPPDLRQARIEAIMSALSVVHRADWRALDLEPVVRGAGSGTPVERYLAWFWKTVEWSAPAFAERLGAARQRLLADEPSEHPDDLSLVHGDPALGNYMLSGTQVTGVIDWELAGILAPAYDVAMQCLANSYYRALSAPDVSARIPSDEDWIAMYEGLAGRRVVHFDYYRRVAAWVLLSVQASMARNFSGQALEQYLVGLEPIWAIAEGR